jgi:mannose-6-phosphate isomerase-like protein (cupin superfamily)
MTPTEVRPWGSFTNLYESDYTKVKTITVNPGGRLSLQSHEKREENWTVIKGTVTIQINNEIKDYLPGEHVFIEKKARHRMENRTDTPVEIIEVQTGTYFGEDDIIRYEDDYQRVK